MTASRQLIEYLDRTRLPWMYYDHRKQRLIVVVDNHLMQTYRACSQHFIHAHVEGWHRRAFVQSVGKHRIWYLEFGFLLHKMLELYYPNFRNKDFSIDEWATVRGLAEWLEADMDMFANEKEYKLIGGKHGFIGLLHQFATTFTAENELIRIIGSEISFGRAGEVPLYIGPGLEVYLAGRMDLIIDDGYFICPMDHKTEGKFRGEPGLKYQTEDGPTGYIYALAHILPKIVPAGELLKRDCSKILMNLIQKTPADDPKERFKRVPIRKTTDQLEDYRQRMVSTVQHIVTDMETYVSGFAVMRNTTACTNWFFRECVFRDVCRQSGKDNELNTLQNGYIQLPIWNTEEVTPTT